MNLAALTARLAALDLDTTANTALASQAEALADTIRASLSTEPGGPHDRPWLRTGALRDSIGASSDGPQALVGSTSVIARLQENGTAELPPRPFLAPAAAANGLPIARATASSVLQALRSL